MLNLNRTSAAFLLIAAASLALGGVTVGDSVISPPANPGADYRGVPSDNPADHFKDLTAGTGNDALLTHVYNTTTHVLTMQNAAFPDRVKVVWIKLVFNRTTTPEFLPALPQAIGQQLDASMWASATAPNATVSVTAASAVRNPHSEGLTIFQTFEIDPQPSEESIDLTNLLRSVGGGNATAAQNNLLVLECKTECSIPTAGTATLLGMAGIVALRRRR